MRHQAAYTLCPPRRFRLIGAIALTLIGGLIAIAAIHTLRDGRSAPAIVAPVLAPARVPSGPIAASDVATADTLLADVYPSKQSAVRALARRLPDAIATVAERPAKFRLNVEPNSTPGAMVRDALRTHFPSAAIASESQTDAKAADGEVVIEVRVDDLTAKSARAAAKGNVQFSIAGASRSTSLATRFTQCDWADDLTTYINENPGHNWIVIRSRRPGLTPGEAKRSAEQNAADVLDRLVREQSARRIAPTHSAPGVPPAQPGDARQLPITDRFVQRFRRPYGDVWQESILLDASPQWVDASLRREGVILLAREMRVEDTVASTAIVLLAILAAYAFANVVTKRYFTGRLRAAAITAALAAVAVAVGIITVA